MRFVFEGAYMYIESSAPRKLGDNAVFVSPSFRPGKDRCMTFWLVRIVFTAYFGRCDALDMRTVKLD